MRFRNISLRNRIFVSMILLVVVMSSMIALVSYVRYINERKEYNQGRLLRKEESTRIHINIELEEEKGQSPISAESLPKVFNTRIYDIANVHNLDVAFYDLQGKLLISSIIAFENSPEQLQLPIEVLRSLKREPLNRITGAKDLKDNKTLQYSYSYIYEDDSSLDLKPVAILKLQYTQDNTDQEEELREFLGQLALVFLLVLGLGVLFAYFIAKYVTSSLKTISEKLSKTAIDRRNEKIILDNPSSEIYTLIESYNAMVDDLADSASQLAKSEREQAWREMAKQVAHEIKNPLTPMRLTVQSFERRFDPNDPDIQTKLKEFSDSLVEQIDVMSSIASAFSDFAKMPSQQKEPLNVVSIVRRSLEIFQEDYIDFKCDEDVIMANLDRTQLIRILTNLVTNALHAVESNVNPKILIKLYTYKEDVIIDVIDNGKGIAEEFKALVFEPKFTTKTSGMGLGLPMIKNIIEGFGGDISFVSKQGVGTTFTVRLPKE